MPDKLPSLPTWNQIDEMVDSDPLALRDLAWRLVQTLDRVQPLREEARERLARHLYVTFCGTAPGWDDPARAPLEGRDRWRERADEILAVIAGKEG